jgi:predicted permease
LELWAELLSIVAPVYICAGLGYVWVRSGRSFPTRDVTELIMLVGAPCLAFSRLIEVHVSIEAMAQMFAATVAALAAFLVIGLVVLRVARLPLRTYLPPLTFGNTGNMGLPVCLLAFGEAGLALGVCYYAVTASAMFSVGVAVSSGRLSLRELARTPLILAVALAIVVIVAGVHVPDWIRNTTGLLGDIAIPLMQITLGVSLAGLRPRGLGRSSALGAFRILMGLGVGFALAELLALEGIVRSVFIIDCAMPAAVFNYLLAERYGQRPEEVASVVMLSTLIAFGSLPLILALVL